MVLVEMISVLHPTIRPPGLSLADLMKRKVDRTRLGTVIGPWDFTFIKKFWYLTPKP
jgi:hypothetical protein